MNEITKDHELGKKENQKEFTAIINLQSSKLVTSQKDFKICWNFSSKKSFCSGVFFFFFEIKQRLLTGPLVWELPWNKLAQKWKAVL